MNSIRCNKCGNFVADNTPFCPYCGNPIRAIPPQPKNNNNVLLAIIILLLSLIIGMMVWMFWGDKIVDKVRGKEKPREEMVAPTKDAGDAEDIRDAEADVPGAEADADVSATAAPAAPAVAEEVAAPAAVAPVEHCESGFLPNFTNHTFVGTFVGLTFATYANPLVVAGIVGFLHAVEHQVLIVAFQVAKGSLFHLF